MNQNLHKLVALFMLLNVGCNSEKQRNDHNTDLTFSTFTDSFLDAYWKQYPTLSIYAGYGKYYDKLVVPDSSAFAGNISFSNSWLDSLDNLDYGQLDESNKISYNIIRNQLQSDLWYTTVFKQQEWDASIYNISGPCDYIINQPYAPLEDRLKILSRYLQHTDDYYEAALSNLHRPTKEHLELSILQNQAGTTVFGAALSDSINASHLTNIEKDSLQQYINNTIRAMNNFTAALKTIMTDPNFEFRNFRIGKKLFTEKFKYDIATDLTPEQVYEKAVADKHFYHRHMFIMADSVWTKYYPTENKPTDSLKLVQMVLNKIQLNHVRPAEFFNQVNQQVYALKKFILEKDLFDFDTSATPIKVRYMPEYARGVTLASAEFIPPYQKQGTTYYNIDDLTLYPPEKAESALREANYYGSQMLSIHEAVPAIVCKVFTTTNHPILSGQYFKTAP